MPLAAVVQLRSTGDRDANWRATRTLIERAASHGAQVVATPENTNFLGALEEKVRHAEPLDGPTCSRFSELAKRLGIYLLLGSFNEQSDRTGRAYNTSVFFDPAGSVLATYRKIHLFDVDVSEQVRFNESSAIIPGVETTVVRTPLGCFGLSICYDLRFPELYRKLVDRGAEILLVPSAFTVPTGTAHWRPLLRARAIECQSYVLAPAQWGRHDEEGTRESFGHSMIVDPWGCVTATVSEGSGFALADIDLDRVARVRRAMPISEHRRLPVDPSDLHESPMQ